MRTLRKVNTGEGNESFSGDHTRNFRISPSPNIKFLKTNIVVSNGTTGINKT